MSDINKIHIELSDWLYNAGLVGLINILDSAGYSISKKRNYIEFDINLLDGFEDIYFKYFISKYGKFLSWSKIVDFRSHINRYESEGINDKDVIIINDQIGYVKDRIKSNSYKSAYEIANDNTLVDISGKLNKIKYTKKDTIENKKSEIVEQLNILSEIITKLEQDPVKKYVTSKNVIYDYITSFWENVSFLDRQRSKNCMYKEFKEYFIDKLYEYKEADKEKYVFNCFSCNSKMKSMSNAFGLAWLKKLGVDTAKKSSHFWNLNSDASICPVCNLVYACVPAGFTFYNRTGFFINTNSSIVDLISGNRHPLEESTTINELEQQTYYKIVDSISLSETYKANKEIENIQIVKIDSKNESRPYTFNILSKEKLQLINNNKSRFKRLLKAYAKIDSKTYINIYSETIKAVYDNRNLFKLISDLLLANLSNNFKKLDTIEVLLKINNNFLGGIMKEKKIDENKIFVIKDFGIKLRKLYSSRSAENKLNGISYRLVNALKTKNKARFMDTLINSYMYLNEKIPGLFIEALNDDEKFQTIGYSFLLGLQGEDKKYEKKNEEDKEVVSNG